MANEGLLMTHVDAISRKHAEVLLPLEGLSRPHHAIALIRLDREGDDVRRIFLSAEWKTAIHPCTHSKL